MIGERQDEDVAEVYIIGDQDLSGTDCVSEDNGTLLSCQTGLLSCLSLRSPLW